MSPNGDMKMRFTSKMKFPPEILAQINSDKRILRTIDRSKPVVPKNWLSVELIFFPGVEDPMSLDIQLKWEI